MATLIKRAKKYYSKIAVRVGTNKLNKKKIVYVRLLTDRYSYAKKRNLMVTHREHKIRAEIRRGYLTKSDLLNINESTNWAWIKSDGTDTIERLVSLNDYVSKFIEYKKIKKMRDATIQSYTYALNKFVKSVGPNYLVSDISQENIDDFIE